MFGELRHDHARHLDSSRHRGGIVLPAAVRLATGTRFDGGWRCEPGVPDSYVPAARQLPASAS